MHTTAQSLERQPVRLPRELTESPGFLLSRLGHRLKGKSIKEFEAAGLSGYAYAVLALLDEGSCRSQATIAEALSLDRSQVVGLLDELEEQGLLDRRRDRKDRRRHVVSVTPAGRSALTRCRSIARGLEEEFLAPLTDEEQEQLYALLLRVARHHDPRFL
jgi:MarR family transcriptional regulator, lower aerobic nicotinate degradation pathway regulator